MEISWWMLSKTEPAWCPHPGAQGSLLAEDRGVGKAGREAHSWWPFLSSGCSTQSLHCKMEKPLMWLPWKTREPCVNEEERLPGSLRFVWGWIPCGGSCLFCRVSPSTPLHCCPEVSSRHGAIWTKNTKRWSEDETSANSSTPQVREMATQNRYQQCRRQFSWDQAKACPTTLPRNEPPLTAPLPLTRAKSTPPLAGETPGYSACRALE